MGRLVLCYCQVSSPLQAVLVFQSLIDVSTVVMIMFYRYYRKYGTAKSTHARQAEDGKSGFPQSKEMPPQIPESSLGTDVERSDR